MNRWLFSHARLRELTRIGNKRATIHKPRQGSWSSPAWPADVTGTLENRTPSVTFDAQSRPLAVWRGQIYEDGLDPYSSIIFRRGVPDNTWDDWFVLFEHAPDELSMAPSVCYFGASVKYGVEVVWHASGKQVKSVFNGFACLIPLCRQAGKQAFPG